MSRRDTVQRFTGTGVNDNDLLFTTGSVEQHSLFQLMSTAGSVDVEVTLDGTNWSTAALAMEDQGATAVTTYVVATTAGRMAKFCGIFTAVRVRQVGATAATAVLLCGSD